MCCVVKSRVAWRRAALCCVFFCLVLFCGAAVLSAAARYAGTTRHGTVHHGTARHATARHGTQHGTAQQRRYKLESTSGRRDTFKCQTVKVEKSEMGYVWVSDLGKKSEVGISGQYWTRFTQLTHLLKPKSRAILHK